MRTSELVDKIYPAYIAAQKAMGKLIKDAENPFFKSAYASLENVLDVVKPVFLEQGIAILQGGGTSAQGINVITRLIHESGQWIEADFPIPLSKQDPQAAGSASSYGRRYSLKGLACLAEVDDDAQSSSEEEPRAERTDESLKPATPGQIQIINDLFVSLEASEEQVQATCLKFSGKNSNAVDGLMKSQAARMITKLNKKVEEKSIA